MILLHLMILIHPRLHILVILKYKVGLTPHILVILKYK